MFRAAGPRQLQQSEWASAACCVLIVSVALQQSSRERAAIITPGLAQSSVIESVILSDWAGVRLGCCRQGHLTVATLSSLSVLDMFCLFIRQAQGQPGGAPPSPGGPGGGDVAVRRGQLQKQLSRRCSLVDLTVSRHERRESMAAAQHGGQALQATPGPAPGSGSPARGPPIGKTGLLEVSHHSVNVC